MEAPDAHSDRPSVSVRSNRVHWFAGRLHEVLDALVGPAGDTPVAVACLSSAETAEAIRELHTATARLAGLQAVLLDHADDLDLATDYAATSTAAWLAHAVTTPRPAAHRTVGTARRLQCEFSATGDALRAGRLDADQATVIVRAVDALPLEVEAPLRRKAEAHLIEAAALHDAHALKVLGKHLHTVVDPEGAEAELGRRLAAEEAKAAQSTVLTLRDQADGTSLLKARIPTLHAAMLAAALDAIASPRRPGTTSDGPDSVVGAAADAAAEVMVSGQGAQVGLDPTDPSRFLSRDEALGRAFCEYVERFPADRLPAAGGLDATVVVTMSLDSLLGGLGPATLDTGQQISAGLARRLACDAGVIPAVLGSDSQVLDLGRRVRLHSKAMRTALRVQHRTCTAEGCTVPAARCHAHHKDPWADGGGTSVVNGTLLCARHHTLVHLPDHTTSYPSDGSTRITSTRITSSRIASTRRRRQ